MNKKYLALLTTGTLLLTTVTAAGCASKRASLLPTTPDVSIQEIQTQPEIDQTEETMVVSPVSQTDAETEQDTFDTLTPLVKTSTKSVKKTVRKTSRKTKKTKKVTKKTTKKTAKKKTTKPSKTTGSRKFSYGYSAYNYKNMAVYVEINKDNTAKFSVVEMHHNDKELQYEIYWSGTGTIDPETNKLTYKDCVKTILVSTNTGKNTRMHYSDGRGTFKFNGNSLKWNDNHDYSGNDFTFTKV